MKNTVVLFFLILFLSIVPVHAAKVDINKADAQTLQENLEGVGDVKAKAIVNYRKKHGNFKTLEDLMQVPGIGEATIKKNRRNLSLKGGLSKTSKKPREKAASKKPVKKKTGSKTEKSTKVSRKSDKKSKAKKSTKGDK